MIGLDGLSIIALIAAGVAVLELVSRPRQPRHNFKRNNTERKGHVSAATLLRVADSRGVGTIARSSAASADRSFHVSEVDHD